MAERPKLLYILVEDEEESGIQGGRKVLGARYTRPVLQSTLQLMGCKIRHAFKISDRVFEMMRSEMPLKKPRSRHLVNRWIGSASPPEQPKKEKVTPTESKPRDNDKIKVSPKRRMKRPTVTVSRKKFLDVVCDGLAQYHYLGPKQRSDLMVACRVRERKTSVTVLLCGTSGCGKSTLSSLLASRLGVTTVVSTDSVRHMMRGFVTEKENPLLWASTYHAGEFLDPVAVTEALAKKKEAKQASLPLRTSSSGSQGSLAPTTSADRKSLAQMVSELTLNNGNSDHSINKEKHAAVEEIPKSEGSGKLESADSLVGAKVMAVQGFKAQSEMVMDSLDRLITAWEARKESVVVEGVHLSLNFVMGLMKKHPSIIPFMVYISNEGKHMERFAVRAKYMTLDPARNKYVKYIRNIRTIQDYLCKRADKHLVPKVNNTNVDKSVAAIHATVFSCLRRREEGEPLLDQATNTVKVVQQEYTKQSTASSVGSKGMFQLIQRRSSSRNLMAVMNNDGTVVKAWPLLSVQVDRRRLVDSITDRGAGTPLYGPLSVTSAKHVNLPFGNLGLSAWPSDKGGTSENSSSVGQSSGEGSTGELLRHASSSASSLMPEKELTEEVEVSDSEEEEDGDAEEEDAETNGDASNSELEPVEEDDLEGSVNDESIRSDDDFEETDIVEGDDGYWYDDDTTPSPILLSTATNGSVDRGKSKAGMSRLRSFDRAAAGQGPPQLRKSASHKISRMSSRKQTKPS